MNASLRVVRPLANPPSGSAPVLDLRSIYEARFGDVCRWLRALGIPDSDREDVAQEVFLVVDRKLAAFDGRDLGAWLYRITANTASDQRRRAWWKNLFGRRATRVIERQPSAALGPALCLEREQQRRLVWRLLDQLGHKHRVVIALYEIEGYSVAEIAALADIPTATVKTRLHYARQKLLRIAEHDLGPAGDGEGGARP